MKYGRIILLALVLLTTALVIATGVSAGPGHHVDSETPGSNEAVIFSPFGPLSMDDKASMDFVKAKAQDHNYMVTEFLDPTEAGDDNPGGATALNFLSLNGSGLVYVVSHGDTDDPTTPAVVEPNLLLVETYATAIARNTKLAGYTGPPLPPPFGAGDLVACDQFQDHAQRQIFGICITEQGITNHFTDNNSIVHIAACFSFNLREEFNAREYFGYAAVSTCPQIRSDTEALWGRMHGATDNGTRRAASRAFAGGGFTPIFRYLHRADVALQTVLSPAISEHSPTKLPVSIQVAGSVRFDTVMKQVLPQNAITIVNDTCNATIKNPQWADNFTLTFQIQATQHGQLTLKVPAAAAVSAPLIAEKQLDGNQNPANTDHVGPNKDDFLWEVTCNPPLVAAVGGNVGEIPDSVRARLEASDTSGSNGGVLAGAVAGAIAVSAITLGGAAWYLRRRRIS